MQKLYLELRDDNDKLLYYLHNKARDLTWQWLRVGGCGSCKFTLAEKFDSDIVRALKPNYRIYIKIDGVTWYAGYIDKITPQASGKEEKISVFALGFAMLLKHLVVQDLEYKSLELSQIAKDIIDSYVAPRSPIVSAAENYQDTLFTPDILTFNTTAYEAIKTLSDIAGNSEWGVDANMQFFFKRRDTDIKHYFFIDEDIISFKANKDYKNIVTRLILEGGEVSGERFRHAFELTEMTFTREKRLTYGSITTHSVAQQLARMYLKKHGLPMRNYSVKRLSSQRLESTIPVGAIAINKRLGINQQYDVAGQKYDSGLQYDGGTVSFQLDKITYKVTHNDRLETTVSAGEIEADMTDELSRLDHQINQVKNY